MQLDLGAAAESSSGAPTPKSTRENGWVNFTRHRESAVDAVTSNDSAQAFSTPWMLTVASAV
ncbi:MAG: hypothetical protein HS111_12415 [Kofleriaceae bacterium]|nr:hypothetical protein [Kofleriaceae bacterium]